MAKAQPTKPKTTKKTTRKTIVKKKTLKEFNAMIDERIYSGEDLGLAEIEQAKREFFGK